MSDQTFLETVKNEQQEIIGLLKDLVGRESPSTDKTLVDGLGSFLMSHMKKAGFSPQVIPRKDVGDIIWTEWDGGAGGSILVLCHIDTVWEPGSLARLPFRIEGNRIHGPGIFDMKAGVAATLKIQDYIAKGRIRPKRKVRFLYTTDEEIGSLHSQELIEEFSRQSDLVLVTEPPLPGGVLKNLQERSGNRRYQDSGTGRPCRSRARKGYQRCRGTGSADSGDPGPFLCRARNQRVGYHCSRGSTRQRHPRLRRCHGGLPLPNCRGRAAG